MPERFRKRDGEKVTQYTVEIRSKYNKHIKKLAAESGRSIRSVLAYLLEKALEH